MAPNADPYRTLGLSRGASLDEVKRAYRRLAKANHPDAAGPGAVPRFLAIQAAYEQIAGGSASAASAARPGSPPRRPATGPASNAGRPRGDGDRPRADRPGTPGARPSSASDGGGPSPRPGRGKATLGSTSYDGADTGPFEPDWGGASWYGTTSGTYWTINPKEYADPRKHGPEYQARARRAGGAKDSSSEGDRPGGPSRRPGAPGHTTSSWWESTSGPAATPDPDGDATEPPAGATGTARASAARAAGADPSVAARRHPPVGRAAGEAALDPASAAVDLGRALTDPRSGGMRGRALRAVLGWLPIALGVGWLVGEVSGCGRFAATCDPSVSPLVAVGQGIALAALLLLPEIAAVAAGAALVLLGAAVAASLILSATGAAADEGSRRAALGALLVLAWLTGLAIAVVRRVRSGSRPAGPVS